MAIFIDPPLWKAHGTLWSHLVSDTSYAELHEFAERVPLPRRGFDLDHYDVPASVHDRVVSLGAKSVSVRELTKRLREAGLRVKPVERESVKPLRRQEYLSQEWAKLAEYAGLAEEPAAREGWGCYGRDLLSRWSEPHRHYHDAQHLEDVLLSLNQLSIRGETILPETLLAAWFHDAVYAGEPELDERASAALAEKVLTELGFDSQLVEEVERYILATIPGAAPTAVPRSLAQLLDADLAIFAAGQARYRRYADAIRLEYAHVPEQQFRQGRAKILRGYLDQPTLFRTKAAGQLWEQQARRNLAAEIDQLLAD